MVFTDKVAFCVGGGTLFLKNAYLYYAIVRIYCQQKILRSIFEYVADVCYNKFVK